MQWGGAAQFAISSCIPPQLLHLVASLQLLLVWPNLWHFLAHLGGPGKYGLGVNAISLIRIFSGASPSKSSATVEVGTVPDPLSVLKRYTERIGYPLLLRAS